VLLSFIFGIGWFLWLRFVVSQIFLVYVGGVGVSVLSYRVFAVL
jgi:hypothetical protein